ncbi:MAG: hypothetical protein WCA79_11090 [Anaerolineales bacterium]
MKPTLIIATVLTLMLSACAPKAVPTIDPAQVQASAVAAANTMVAMTQAAIPTETLAPPTDTPTDTPQDTPTIPPLPTISQALASATPPPASSSSGGDCAFLSVSHGEHMAKILVNNKINAPVTVSFYLKKNAFGDCGYWGLTGMNPNGSTMLTNLPQGCYSVGAWTLSKPDRMLSATPFCDSIPDKFTINITIDGIIIVAY